MNWFNHGKVDIIVIDRFYRREEADKLPEHIKNNLRSVVDGLTVEHHRWPNRKEMLFVVQDGEQQRLARWYPLGMQDEVFQQYTYRHGFPDSWGDDGAHPSWDVGRLSNNESTTSSSVDHTR